MSQVIPRSNIKPHLHPFGMLLTGRTWSAGGENYRFGFNGKENIDEINSDKNFIDFGARLYDCRIGKWMSPDPLAIKYAYASPYVYTLNCPTYFIDPNGKQVVGTDGRPVEYEVVKGENGKFNLNITSDNIDQSSDAFKILTSLVLQSKGREALESMKTSTVNFKVENFHLSDSPNEPAHARTTFSEVNNGLPVDPVITIYTNDDQFGGNDRMENLKGMPIDFYISATASHEILGHALDPEKIAIDLDWGAYGSNLQAQNQIPGIKSNAGFQIEFRTYFIGVVEYEKLKIDMAATNELLDISFKDGKLVSLR